MKKIFGFCVLLVLTIFVLPSCNTSRSNGEKIDLLSNPTNKASCVFLTSDEHNVPVVSWVEIDSTQKIHFYLAQFDTLKEKFSSPVPIPIAQNASIHEEGMPKIAVKGDGTIVAIYETSTPYKDFKWGLGNIRYVQSFDNGKTWTSPQSVAPKDFKAGRSASFTDIIRLGDGEIGLSWLGINPEDSIMARPVYFAKTKGKNGFGQKILITRHACQCCRTALSSDEKGDISIAFRDILPGSVRDISVSTSSDFGQTFSRTVSFSEDSWVVDGCPHNGPSVSTRNNHTYVAWFTGGKNSGVYYAELDSNKNLIAKKHIDPNGRFIQLSLLPNGTRIAAYNEHYQKEDSMYSRIMVYKIGDNGYFRKEITHSAVQATYPVIRPIGNHKTVVAWIGSKKVYYKLVKTDKIKQPAPEVVPTSIIPKATLSVANLSSNIDPVCGMTLNASNIGDTTIYHEKTIGFCSDHCKHQFLEYPEKYVN